MIFRPLDASPRPDWRRALRAIRRMQLDPTRSDQVFELNVALDAGDAERRFQHFLRLPQGTALLEEAPSLIEVLSDFEALRQLEPGSLGRSYLELMEANGHSPDGLRQAAAQIEEFAELHPGEQRTWFAQRENCVHDLLHVVTGYGQDAAGETALLAFCDGIYSQAVRLRVVRFGMIASLVSAPLRSIADAVAFSLRARRRGLRARISSDYRWEEKLSLPLALVQQQLNIEPLLEVHPRGVLQGDMDRWRFALPAKTRPLAKTRAASRATASQ